MPHFINHRFALILISLITLLASAHGKTSTAISYPYDWQEVPPPSSISNTRLYTNRAQEKVQAVKMDLPIQAPLEMVLCVLRSAPLNPLWIPRSQGAKVIQTEGEHSWVHFRSDFPWPFKDRDAIMKFTLSEQLTPEEHRIHIVMESQSDKLKAMPGYKRVESAKGEWILTSERNPLEQTTTQVTYINDFDPGLPLPTFLVNRSIVENTWNTGKNLKQFVEAMSEGQIRNECTE